MKTLIALFLMALTLARCGIPTPATTVAPTPTAPSQPLLATVVPGTKMLLNTGSDGTLQPDGTWKNVTVIESSTSDHILYLRCSIDAQHNVLLDVDDDLSGEGPDIERHATLHENVPLYIVNPAGSYFGTLMLKNGIVYWYPPDLPRPSGPAETING